MRLSLQFMVLQVLGFHRRIIVPHPNELDRRVVGHHIWSHILRAERGCGRLLGLVLCRESKALPVFDGTERAKGDLDALLVVPADVGVHSANELLNGRGLPIPG